MVLCPTQEHMTWGKAIMGQGNFYTGEGHNTSCPSSMRLFFYIHLGYSFNSITLFDHSPFTGGISPPGRVKWERWDSPHHT